MRFNCPRCMMHLQAPPEAAGAKCHCPRCYFSFIIPAQSPDAPPVEEYPLRRTDDPDASERERIPLILVVCPVCQTRMYGEYSQVGEELECPDCGTMSEVRPPPPCVEKPPRVTEEIDGYQLADEADRTRPDVSAAERSYVAVVCPVCNTRMHAVVDQVGETIDCPDCGTATVVPSPPPPAKKIDPMADAGEGYRLIDWNESTRLPRTPPPPPAPQSASAALYDRPIESNRFQPVVPRWPLLTGTFSFPFGSSARNYTIILTVISVVVCLTASTSQDMMRVETLPSLSMSALFLVVSLMLFVGWFALASSCAMAVVCDTANGCDEVRAWPDLKFLDWFGEVFFTFNALCLSMMPGVAAAWLLRYLSVPVEAVILFTAYLLFPIVFLSMLEKYSSLNPFSAAVWKTLATSPGAWASFYLLAAVLAAPFVCAEIYLPNKQYSLIIIAVWQPAAWLIYFRLLGRLALYCIHGGEDDDDIEDEIEDDA